MSAASSKSELEAYRVRQHAGPHPALDAMAQAAPNIAAGGFDGEAVVPDTGRVILHFDVDSFYAQVEEVRLLLSQSSMVWMRSRPKAFLRVLLPALSSLNSHRTQHPQSPTLHRRCGTCPCAIDPWAWCKST
jgi:hypothetical protein